MTAFDDSGVVGHFIMRYINGNNKILRFGWVIVDDTQRGKGYGKQMLELGLKYAFEISDVEKVTIGVFENNIPAYKCYKSIGFNEIATDCYETETVNGEESKIIELEITKSDYINHNKRK